jgi:hypothetical protein
MQNCINMHSDSNSMCLVHLKLRIRIVVLFSSLVGSGLKHNDSAFDVFGASLILQQDSNHSLDVPVLNINHKGPGVAHPFNDIYSVFNSHVKPGY